MCICLKQMCITFAKRTHTWTHTHTYKYTHIYICDYLSIGEFKHLWLWRREGIGCYMRFVAHQITGLSVTDHIESHLLLSTLLSSKDDRSMSQPTDWTFWEAFNILVTCKEIFERIVLQAGIREADVYNRWDRCVLLPKSGCFRWLQNFYTLPPPPTS
jgi:hypothetical protein